MVSDFTGLAGLHAFLERSRSTYACELDPDGVVVEASEALVAAAGRPLEGVPFVELVSRPQRRAVARRLVVAGEDWSTVVVALALVHDEMAEDRCLHLRTTPNGVLVIAEPAQQERDHLVGQLLALNDDLIGTQRTLARRQRQLEAARRDTERAMERLATLERITVAGLVSDDLGAVLSTLLDQACRLLGADRGTILLSDDDSTVLTARAWFGEGWRTTLKPVPYGTSIAGRVVAENRTVVVDDMATWPHDVTDEVRDAGGSLIAAPLTLHGEAIGVLHVGGDERGCFDADDARALELIADRAALAIGHAQVVAREHRLAETLQRSLLPVRLPHVGGLELTARYLPQAVGDQLGGDWYDAIAFEDGRIGLFIGDVAGKGLGAAVAMGQVRSAMRALALLSPEPVDVLTRLDPFVADMDTLVTALYVLVDPRLGEVRYASAGHLPALLREPDGTTVLLGDGLSPPLGLGRVERHQAHAPAPSGSHLVLYTDGLVERRGDDLLLAIEQLRRCLQGAPGDVDALCDHLVTTCGDGTGRFGDDVAVLTARLP